MAQLEVRTLKETGFIVPVGWYGFIAAAGSGIIRMAGLGLEEGLSALERLGSEDKESRTPDHGGRRLVRVSGGYIALNYDNYRKKDHTAAERSKRYRLRKQTEDESSRVALVTSRVSSHQHHSTITQAEAEAEAEGHSEEESFKNVRKRTVTNRTFQKPSSEELELHASKIGLPKEEVARFVNYYEANGWRVGRNPMKSWTHAMQNWKINFDANRGSAPTSRRSAMDIRTIMQAKEKLCSTIRFQYASETAMDTIWSDDDKRIEYFKLKKEIKALNTELSEMV